MSELVCTRIIPITVIIYVENLDTLHTKLVPIPLGILNHNKQLYTNIKIPKLSTHKIQVFCAHRVREGTQSKNCKRFMYHILYIFKIH